MATPRLPLSKPLLELKQYLDEKNYSQAENREFLVQILDILSPLEPGSGIDPLPMKKSEPKIARVGYYALLDWYHDFIKDRRYFRQKAVFDRLLTRIIDLLPAIDISSVLRSTGLSVVPPSPVGSVSGDIGDETPSPPPRPVSRPPPASAPPAGRPTGRPAVKRRPEFRDTAMFTPPRHRSRDDPAPGSARAQPDSTPLRSLPSNINSLKKELRIFTNLYQQIAGSIFASTTEHGFWVDRFAEAGLKFGVRPIRDLEGSRYQILMKDNMGLLGAVSSDFNFDRPSVRRPTAHPFVHLATAYGMFGRAIAVGTGPENRNLHLFIDMKPGSLAQPLPLSDKARKLVEVYMVGKDEPVDLTPGFVSMIKSSSFNLGHDPKTPLKLVLVTSHLSARHCLKMANVAILSTSLTEENQEIVALQLMALKGLTDRLTIGEARKRSLFQGSRPVVYATTDRLALWYALMHRISVVHRNKIDPERGEATSETLSVASDFPSATSIERKEIEAELKAIREDEMAEFAEFKREIATLNEPEQRDLDQFVADLTGIDLDRSKSRITTLEPAPPRGKYLIEVLPVTTGGSYDRLYREYKRKYRELQLRL